MNESPMKIAHFISELLFRYDCVIVPGFGGFVTNYEPARIHPINHTFSPPCKSILFNSSLIKDDGLLLHTISSHESVSYEHAKNEVISFVKQCFIKLDKGEKLNFKHIGILKRDAEGSLTFEPDTTINYLEESFGLPTFVSPPIIRQSASKRLEKKFIDRKPVPEKENKRKKVLAAVLIFIPVLFFAGWFTFSSGVFHTNQQQSSLLPSSAGMEDLTKSTDDNPANENHSITPIKDLNFEGHAEELIPEQASVIKEPERKQPIVEGPKYYIIGGAFSVPENAEKLIARLRNKGYQAESAGQSPSGLFMVCYYKSEDKKEALTNLAIIRQDDNPSAWLLKK